LSYDIQIDKDRAYASQCYIRVRWYCPVCILQTKLKKHCKIHKTPSSWWWHIKHDHGKFVNRKFSFDDLRAASNYLVKALEWGIVSEAGIEEFIDEPVATTTSSILFDGKSPRLDVFRRLKEIAKIYKISRDFPNLNQKQVDNWAFAVLGHPDSRTLEKYVKCVTDYSITDNIKGQYDVTQFCKQFGL